MAAKPPAYRWTNAERAKGMIAVTVSTETAKQVAEQVEAEYSVRGQVYLMRPSKFRRFRREFAKVCPHPVERRYAWHAIQPGKTGARSIVVACSDCGEVVSGGGEE